MALVLGEAALCMQPAYSTVAAALAAMRGSPEQAAHVPHLEAFMAAVRSEASPYRAALLDGEQAALDGEELDSQEAEAQRWRAAAAAAKDFTPEQQAASHHFWTAYRVRVASDRAAAAGHPGLNATVWVDGSLQRVQPGAAKAEPMLAYQHGGECGLWLELDGVVWRELAGGVWLELGGDVWHERRGAVRCSCLAPNSTPVVGRAQPRSPTSVPRAHIALPTCAPPPILTRPLPAPPIRPHAGLKGRATANSMPRTPEQGQRQAASRADTMWLMSQVLAGTAGSASAAVAAAAGGMASTAAADPATARTKLVHAVLSTGCEWRGWRVFGLCRWQQVGWMRTPLAATCPPSADAPHALHTLSASQTSSTLAWAPLIPRTSRTRRACASKWAAYVTCCVRQMRQLGPRWSLSPATWVGCQAHLGLDHMLDPMLEGL